MAEKVTKSRSSKRPVKNARKTTAGDKQPSLGAAAEVHSVEARSAVRGQLADDVARFLKTGGSVQEVPKDYRADPPRAPENNYGRGSI